MKDEMVKAFAEVSEANARVTALFAESREAVRALKSAASTPGVIPAHWEEIGDTP